jgi:hypothetical protein
VPYLFSVNRPLVSSKQLRLPTRGMVGNGLRVTMGAVAAFDGTIVVKTRGRRLALAVDRGTGLTNVTSDKPVKDRGGLTVLIDIGGRFSDGELARETARLGNFGWGYQGATNPHWYSDRDLRDRMQQAPAGTTVATVADWFGIELPDARVARDLKEAAASKLLRAFKEKIAPVQPHELGGLGADAYWDAEYHRFTGVTRGSAIPYVTEAWAKCSRSEQRGDGSLTVRLLLNRTQSASEINGFSSPNGITIRGGGVHRWVEGKTGHYDVVLSVIAPCIELASDGKEPALAPFGEGIAAVIEKAAAKAHRAMAKPPNSMEIPEAAEECMVDAYRIASANGTLPANARQIMYAARPIILRLTRRDKLDDNYFTQTILPNYIDKHPEAQEWDVVYDDRGRFIEPHTGRSVGLGTIAVREYLGERQAPLVAASIDPGSMAATTGPENRYENVLFVEKEGFNALLAQAMIAERFDLGIASTKGMSVTALRRLLD